MDIHRNMVRVCAFVLLCWGLATRGLAQHAAPAAADKAPKRQLQAVRLTRPLQLDGRLDEAQWQAAPVATDFIQQRPSPGVPEKHKTEVRVLYDDAALYVGAVMHDASPDSIFKEMTQRDNFGNTDYFALYLDTYRDQLNGYGFFVTASGVQLDVRYSPVGDDFAWNAVWESRTTQQGTDWVAELRIPYSAIRFSGDPAQVWGLNFGRQRERDRQFFTWNEVKPAVSGFVNQWGELTGLRDLHPPLRLSLTPYVSAYVNHFPYNEPGKPNTTTRFHAGADVKYGINESFTLDATLVPDFGQTQSDNVVLNLSPFEVQYNENRPFFTEGTELFNKGQLFYSRRVGAQPLGFGGAQDRLGRGERLLDNPAETRLLGAVKVSGRTSKGLGVGVFNAVSGDIYAIVRDSLGQTHQLLTQPFSNYNVLVLDQSLKNNSYVSLVNTNVTRAGRTYDANVTGGLFRFADKKNAYAVNGKLVYSRRRGQAFGSEAPVANPNGYTYQLEAGKISGTFTWNVRHGIESDTYDPNDLGLLRANNSVTQSLNFGYRKYRPFWKVNNLDVFWGASYDLLYRPRRYQNGNFYADANTTFTRHFLTVGGHFDVGPAHPDFFEPRAGPADFGHVFVQLPTSVGQGATLSSDNRKPLGVDVNLGHRFFAPTPGRANRRDFGVTLSPRYRVNNQLNFRYSFDWQVRGNQIGYAGGLSRAEPLDTAFLGQVILGRRRVSTVTSTLTGNYAFTNRMAFTVRARHYVSSVQYRDFSRLGEEGREEPVAYRRNRDTSFNAFNVDAVFSWWFAPGSQASVVWKNAGSSFLQADEATPQYFHNLATTLSAPHNNSVSMKVFYYLDYLTLKRRQPAAN